MSQGHPRGQELMGKHPRGYTPWVYPRTRLLGVGGVEGRQEMR